MKQFSSKELVESFGYTPQVTEDIASDMLDVAKDTAKTATAGYVGGKVASKLAGKVIPGVGTALSWKDAYDRWQEGDRSGAVIAALAGAAYLAPGVGTAVGTGLDAINIGRDVSSMGDEESASMPSTTDSSAPSAQPTDLLKSLQQIIGAKPDGIYGPETKEKLKTWQAKQGIKVDGVPGTQTYTTAGLLDNKGNKMAKTVAEDIADLRDKLAIIENETIINEISGAKLVSEIWNLVKSGVYNTDDILKQLTQKFGTELPANIKQRIEYAVNNISKKLPTQYKEPGLPVPRKEPGLPALAGAGADEVASQVSRQLAVYTPAEVEALTSRVLAAPSVSTAERQAIKRGGLLSWIEQNPGKASIIAGLIGLGVGTALGPDSSSSAITPSQTSGNATSQAAPSSKKKGDPDIMQKQRMLNALTGSNLKIDGIWGPATQAAADNWHKISASQNADMQDQLAKIKTAGTTPEAPATTSPEDALTPSFSSGTESDAYKELTKNVPKSVSESDELARIIQLLK